MKRYKCHGTLEFRWEAYPDESFPDKELIVWERLAEIMGRNSYLLVSDLELTNTFLRIKFGSQMRMHKPERPMYSVIDGLETLMRYAASFWMDLKLVSVKWDDTETEVDNYEYKTKYWVG